MNAKYHTEITQLALEKEFSQSALNTIIAANLGQDHISLQIGHDYIHFDSNAFASGFAYIKEQERLLFHHLQSEEISQAWQCLGRITHSWQDFFSHSNYVMLWVNAHPDSLPEDIVFNEGNIIDHPELISGKIYLLLEVLSMIPVLKSIVKPIMPADSHARMNLDDPSAGPFFKFAYWAAYKATRSVYEELHQHIQLLPDGHHLQKQFKNK